MNNNLFALSLQIAIQEQDNLPSKDDFYHWLTPIFRALKEQQNNINYSLNIRIVDEQEQQILNNTYRGKNYPTNVLSFVFDTPDFIKDNDVYLGDIVICKSVLEKEAKEQSKGIFVHWAHLSIHGTLHLLGYDHNDEQEALEMESKEIEFMKQLGFSNPYQII